MEAFEEGWRRTAAGAHDILVRLGPLWSRAVGLYKTLLSTDGGSPRTTSRIAGASALSAYTCLAVIVAEPRTASRIFPRTDVTNALILTSFTGASVWLWHRPHLAGTLPSRRFQWVLLGGSAYVFGSVLMWAILRTAVGRRPYLNVTLGLVTGAALTLTAVDYFQYLDRDLDPLEVSEELTHSDDDKYDLEE